MPPTHTAAISRRRLLSATGGTAASAAIIGLGATSVHGCPDDCTNEEDHGHDCPDCDYTTICDADQMHGGHMEHGEGEHADPLQEVMCPDHPHATTEPGHTMHHVNAKMAACPTGTGLDVCDPLDEDSSIAEINACWPDCTDWPDETIDTVKESRNALTSPMYNEPVSLLVLGYIPYFDVVLPGVDGGVSHWLHPGYIGNSNYEPDPWRPESIVMDNEWWRPLGPMYIATDNGDPRWANEDDEIMEVQEAWGWGGEDRCGPCFPFHPHDGLPGRFAWWYYRQVHESDYASGDQEDLALPCYTAPMMHSWIYPTPDGPHGDTAGAPPRKYRPNDPPNLPGYPLPATPGEDDLSLEVLPASVQEVALPDRLQRELDVIDDLSVEFLETTPVSELETVMDDQLGPVGDQLDAVGDMDRLLADSLETALETTTNTTHTLTNSLL